MFTSDPTRVDPAAPAARRLSGLGLIPDPPGWVPEQPARLARSERLAPDPEPEPTGRDRRPKLATAQVSVTDAVRAALVDRVPPWAEGLVERSTVTGLLWAIAALVAAVVAGVLYLHRHSGADAGRFAAASTYSAGSGSSFDAASTPAATASSDPPSDPASIVVDVGGRVRKPGLVTLPPGARVADAITAAGGPLRPRELARLDLAARVSDGQLLLVGVKAATSGGDPSATGTDPTGSPAPISLSDATLDQLESLPGVGPVTAQKIVDWRSAHGGFTSVEQLQQIPGIGPAHYAEISPLVSP